MALPPTAATLLLLAAAAGALYGAHRLALWAEGRGWVFYRRRRPTRSALGNAFLEVQSLLEPGQRRVVEERTRVEEEADAAGDPPEPPSRG